jgi:RNase P subunit RPR2
MVKELICPKCKKAMLHKEEIYEGVILNRKKRVVFYCPICEFKNTLIFKLNEQQYQKEMGDE